MNGRHEQLRRVLIRRVRRHHHVLRLHPSPGKVVLDGHLGVVLPVGRAPPPLEPALGLEILLFAILRADTGVVDLDLVRGLALGKPRIVKHEHVVDVPAERGSHPVRDDVALDRPELGPRADDQAGDARAEEENLRE